MRGLVKKKKKKKRSQRSIRRTRDKNRNKWGTIGRE